MERIEKKRRVERKGKERQRMEKKRVKSTEKQKGGWERERWVESIGKV